VVRSILAAAVGTGVFNATFFLARIEDDKDACVKVLKVFVVLLTRWFQ